MAQDGTLCVMFVYVGVWNATYLTSRKRLYFQTEKDRGYIAIATNN